MISKLPSNTIILQPKVYFKTSSLTSFFCVWGGWFINNKKLFLMVLGGKFKIKTPVDFVHGEGFLVHRQLSSRCVLTRRKAPGSSLRLL